MASSSLSPKSRIRKPTPRTKTFTGCWTCRSRHVKCDSVHPECNRCAKAGLRCDGYGIRLYWVDHNDPTPPSATKRRAIISEAPHWPVYSDDIDEYVHDLDRFSEWLESETILSGPFGVFHVSGYEPIYLQHLSNNHDLAIDAGSLEVAVDGHSIDSCLPSSEDISYYLEPSNQPAHSSAIDDSQTIEPRIGESQIDIRSNLSSAVYALNVSACRESLVGILLQHYEGCVANILQPVMHPRNTYSSIYVPRAISAFKKISWESPRPNSGVSACEIALFFSVLASSAFHLRGHDESAKEADSLARHCRTKSLSHLGVALAALEARSSGISHVDSSMLEDILSVVLTLVTADVVDGPMSEFWIHLEASRSISRQLKGNFEPSSHGERLLNISRFLRSIADTTNANLDRLPWLGTDNAHADIDIFSDDSDGLEFTYGITATLANFIRRATLLSQHISFYLLDGKSLPADLVSACDDLFRELSSWHIGQETLLSFSQCDEVTVLLATEHILAFAQSIRIYFHTRVSMCSQADMASYVQDVATHLNEIEAVKKKTGYKTVLAATIAWPGFIASCEAEPAARDVWHQWWNSMLEYRIGNIRDLWSVVKDAWALRDQGVNETPAWAPVLRRSRKRILAI
ncbi:fungal-specific transcription factor domain-containing protein [Hypoxylon crocopeplum]|nr:fungal-specific transcription factor domain-containing protein [Hypoxylon crocopeplum]